MLTKTLLLAVAFAVAPAQADATVVDQDLAQPDMARMISYNGHAGLGASAYQHDQTDLEFLVFSPQGPGSDGLRLRGG